LSTIIKSKPFHIQAYDNIKALILNNEFSPGERLTEMGLAKKLGVSRGPIREAIRMLLQDGLLLQKGVYISVLEPTLEDVIDLYLCRERLEPLATRLATQKISPKNKQSLLEIIGCTKRSLERNDIGKVVQLNTEFHRIIVNSSGNQQLIQFMNLIGAKTVYMRNSILKNYTRTSEFVEEHEGIARAICNNNGDQAELEMKRHIQSDLQAFYSLFEKFDTKG
jgi:DNA-binding GntR family transcriptional regulator